MFQVSKVVEVLQLGVASNWFGLACPHHCGSSTLGLLGFVLLLGFLGGFILASSLGLWIYLYLLAPPTAPPRQSFVPAGRLARLQGYLHEHRFN